MKAAQEAPDDVLLVLMRRIELQILCISGIAVHKVT